MATKTHESSITEQLRALIRLQAVDNRLDQLAKLRGDLPDEIRDLEDEEAGLETRLEKLQDEAKEREVNRRQADLDIKEAEQLIAKYEDQQTQVRNNREYDALTKEIEAQKQRIENAENEIERIESTKEEHALKIEKAQARLDELKGHLDEKRSELDEVLDDTKQEQSKIQELRDEAVEDVDDRYLRAYTRLRNRLRDGRAVVPLERGAAAGFAVPPQRQMEIRQRNKIIVCEHTGRIIVDSEQYEEIEEDLEL